jgi:hypothetical protein
MKITISSYEEFVISVKKSAIESLGEKKEGVEDFIERASALHTSDGNLDFIRTISRQDLDLVATADHDLCDRFDEICATGTMAGWKEVLHTHLFQPDGGHHGHSHSVASFSDVIGAMCFRIYEVALREEIERITRKVRLVTHPVKLGH